MLDPRVILDTVKDNAILKNNNTQNKQKTKIIKKQKPKKLTNQFECIQIIVIAKKGTNVNTANIRGLVCFSKNFCWQQFFCICNKSLHKKKKKK